jgi:hypothetical protein
MLIFKLLVVILAKTLFLPLLEAPPKFVFISTKSNNFVFQLVKGKAVPATGPKGP